MIEPNLTYQWLVPQLITAIGGLILLLLAGITWIVNNALSVVKEMKTEMKSSNEKMDQYFKENELRHNKNELDIARIKEHIPAM